MNTKERAEDFKIKYGDLANLVAEQILHSFNAIYDDCIMDYEQFPDHTGMCDYWKDVIDHLK